MKTVRKWILLVTGILITVDCRCASLLVNGDAETGSLAGWTPVLSGASTGNAGIIGAMTEQEQSGPTVFPFAGRHFFSFAVRPASVALDSGEEVFLYQLGTLGLTNATLRLKGVFQTDGFGGGDEGEANILVLDSANHEIARASSGSLSHPRFPAWAWHPFEVSIPVPPGAAMWRVELRGKVRNGRAVNVFWDSLEMEGLPEHMTVRVSQVEICWNSISNAVYQVEYRSALAPNSWFPLGSTVVGTGTTNCVTDGVPDDGSPRFYRVVRSP